MNRENDDPILELLESSSLALKPADIEYNLDTRNNVDISIRTVHNRLELLVEHGLVVKEDEQNGRYAITDRGQRYLEGDLTAEQLEDTTNSG
ncbi:winged-helix domain-containing protein (plasmid) [Halobacterium sp. NMX12-1]|uniref:Winged-helix domain-containing protein n=1 Tax=Halobacterium sp. NMX12-1 TaxID=3166650 RepID=A0AAU8CJ81_9EURY